MKIAKAVIQNFKNIEAQNVNMEGRSMMVIGKNGSGKSSFMQAVQSPINRKLVPLQPLKDGEDAAQIDIDLAGPVQGVDKQISLEMRFTPSDRKGNVTAYDAEGNKLANGKKAVEDLLGYISFDPFEFARKGMNADGSPSKKGVEEQVNTLKQFLSEEENQKLNDTQQAIDDAIENRKAAKARQKDLDKQVENTELTQEEIEKYQEKKDEQPILDQIENVDKEIENYQYVENQVKEFEKEKQELVGELGDITEEVEDIIIRYLTKRTKLKGGLPPYRLLGEARDILANAIDTAEIEYYGEDHREEGIEEKIKKGNTWLKEKAKPSSSELNQQLEEVRQWNKKVDEVKEKEEVFRKARENKEEVKKWEDEVTRLENEKKKLFEESSLPVEGLSFDEDKVLFNGLPFNESQIPTSDIIKVGCQIGMALNPTVRLITIHDGSLLDDDSLNELVDIVEKNDYQLLIERVSDDEEVTVEYIESDVQ